MAEQVDYPVTFKHGDQTLFETRGSLEEGQGEPHDTLNIFFNASKKVREAINRRELPDDTFKICDAIVIERPKGKLTEYSDDQINGMIDEQAALGKYNITRDTRLVVFSAGGFTGGVIDGPHEVTLDALSDQDFARVIEITDLLQRPSAKKELKYADWVGDFGYYVRAGEKDTSRRDMKHIFEGGSFSRTPVIVEELRDILKTYATRPEGKPGFALGRGPGGV